MFKRQDVPLFLLERAKGHSDADPFRINFCERVTKWLHRISWLLLVIYGAALFSLWISPSPLTELTLSLVYSAALILLIGILSVSPSHEELVHRDKFFESLECLQKLLKVKLEIYNENEEVFCDAVDVRLTDLVVKIKAQESSENLAEKRAGARRRWEFNSCHEALVWFQLVPFDVAEIFYPRSSGPGQGVNGE